MNTVVQNHLTDVFLASFPARDKLQNASVIDSGCGDGYASKMFVKYGAAFVQSYDPVAKPTFNDPKIKFCNSITNVVGQVDVVWSHHVIEHVNNPVAYLQSLKDLLKSTGELWLGCPNTAEIATFSHGHLNNFTIANLILCLRDAGFNTLMARWILNEGQIRVRITPSDIRNPALPAPFTSALDTNKHFNVKMIPQKWRW